MRFTGFGLTMALVTTLSLTFISPLQPGLAAKAQDSKSQGQFKEIQVQESFDGEPLESGRAVVDGVNPLGVLLPSGAATSVGSGSLKAPTEISLDVYADRPSGRDPRFTPVGPRAVATISLAALNLTKPGTNLVSVWMPADSDLKQRAYRVLQEVSITLPDATDYVYLDQYGDQSAVRITPAILAPIFREFGTPKTLRISVQAVDAKGWYEELAPGFTDENSGG